MTRERYDPMVYVHWLYWRLKVLESGYMDFRAFSRTSWLAPAINALG